MTTKLEQEFFEAMGIVKLEPCKYGFGCGHAKPCCPREKTYPTITDTIVLRLIKILLKLSNEFHIDISKNEYGCNTGFVGGYYEDTFEHSILSLCIQLKDEIRKEVQKLFI